MEMAGEVAVDAGPRRVWAALNDPEILRRCIPGCEEVRQLSPTETHTRVLLKMGPVRARFVGKILMSDVRPDVGCTLAFEGSGGAAGFARGSSVVTLVPQDDGTRLRYSASASIGGKLGQIGGRMIDASAKQMADQFFSAFKSQLEDAGAASVASAASVAPATPVQVLAAPAPAPVIPVGATSTAESVRVLWFLLGMASTGFGVWIAGNLGR